LHQRSHHKRKPRRWVALVTWLPSQATIRQFKPFGASADRADAHAVGGTEYGDAGGTAVVAYAAGVGDRQFVKI